MSEQQVLPEFIATLKAAAEKAMESWQQPSTEEYRDHTEGLGGMGAYYYVTGPGAKLQTSMADALVNPMRMEGPTWHRAKFIAESSPENILKLLASLAQSEAERERLQEEVKGYQMAHDYGWDCDEQLFAELGVPLCEKHQKHCGAHVANWLVENKKAKESELAREREANQGLRRALDRCVKAGTERNCLIDREYLRVAVSMAQALLEPKAKPVATTS